MAFMEEVFDSFFLSFLGEEMEHNVPPSQDADSEELVRLPPQGKFIPTAQVDVASVVKFVPSIQLIPESEITSSALLTNIISEIELGDIDELVDAAEDSNRQLAEVRILV
jgi:hypothetical protein